ncbi:unnamed protein product [Parajaminaea phylloscopi]
MVLSFSASTGSWSGSVGKTVRRTSQSAGQSNIAVYRVPSPRLSTATLPATLHRTQPPCAFSTHSDWQDPLSMALSSSASSQSVPRSDRDRLRDYYGLGAAQGQSVPPSPSTTTNAVVSASTIPALLKTESDLLTQIRELDGERQSLVYNHHTDLVAASETIAKMKSHAERLDTTLASLKSSFSAMNRLSQQSSTALLPLTRQHSNNSADARGNVRRDIVSVATLPQRLRDTIALGRSGRGEETSDAGDASARDVPHASPLRTSDNTPGAGLAAAEALWGRHEAILSDWSREGIPGADSIAAECRSVLKEERERAASAERTETDNGTSPQRHT